MRLIVGGALGLSLSLGVLSLMRPYSSARNEPVAPATASVASGSEANGSKRLSTPIASQMSAEKIPSPATVVSFMLDSVPEMTTRTAPVWRTTEASYYADKYEGRLTASGEVFRQYGLTAASPDLPLGTVIEVCRAERCAIVRVNDRMPDRDDGRRLDLSLEAAWRLGFVSRGVARVRWRKR